MAYNKVVCKTCIKLVAVIESGVYVRGFVGQMEYGLLFFNILFIYRFGPTTSGQHNND